MRRSLPIAALIACAACGAPQRPVPMDSARQSARDVQHGDLYIEQRDYPAAEKELRLALSENPGNAEAHAALAEALLAQHRRSEAMQEAQAAQAADGNAARPHDALCLVYTALGDAPHAQAECLEATTRDGSRPKYHHDYAMALGLTDLDKALDEAQKAVTSVPGVALYQRDYGELLRRAGNYEKAAEHLRAALTSDPKDPQAHRALGDDLLAGGRIEDGLRELDTATTLDPSYAEGWNEKGVGLEKDKQVDKAIAAFREAVRLAPDVALYHFNLGVALRAAPGGTTSREGMAELDETVRLAPQDGDFLYEDVVAHGDAGDTAGALDRARKLVSLLPGKGRPQNLLGLMLERSGDTAGARKTYEQAVAQDPACGPCHYNLGHLLIEQGDLDAALTQAQAAVADLPNDPDAQALWGVAAYRKGDATTAEAQFRKALQLDPSKPVYHFNLGMVLAKEDQEAEAKKELEAFLQSAPADSPDLKEAKTTMDLLGKTKSKP